MATQPGKRLSNNRGRIARTRPPQRDETSLSGQALEYDLQQIMVTDDVKRIASTIVIESGGGGGSLVNDVNLTMPLEYNVNKSFVAAIIDFAVTWLAENPNTFLLGPPSGTPAVPGFRLQINEDLPPRSQIKVVPITFSASITPDASLGSEFEFTATSNFTLNAPTGMLHGQKMTVIITQDGTGSRLWTLDPLYRHSTFLTPAFCTLTTTPGARDYFGFQYDSHTGTFDILSFVPGVT